MAIVIPFKGIRPAKDKVHLVATRSVDRYKAPELNAKLQENPYTFFHVIKPEFGQLEKSRPNSPELLKKIKNKYLDFIKKEILVHDTELSYYIYRQQNGTESFTGIIGCAAIDDYKNDVIKKHEQTLTEKEEKLKEYLEVCDFNAEPICMSYPDNKALTDFTEKYTKNIEPVYDFTTTDTLRHTVWKVSKKEDVANIQNTFAEIPAIYIADGHHRSAASVLLGESKRAVNKNYTGKEAYNYYMCIYFPESQLKIYDYNRVVKDLNGLSSKEFLDKISENFTVQIQDREYKPTKQHNFSLYLNRKWYSLTAKKDIIKKDPVGSLDSQILTDYILSPILNIRDLKTDKRVAFVSGIKGTRELRNIVDSNKMQAAFALFPATMEEVKKIADTNNIMPPKTTWVEPKLRSGLIIYSLED